jgi:Tfp pilus assembly protein PilF|nr:tetratricopeptide repeat protein [Kofleriaceae bacterium]
MAKRWVLLAAVLYPSVALADLQAGHDKLVAGDYKGAIAELQKVTGKDKPDARVMLADAQIATGDYAGAEQTIAPLAADKANVAAHLVFDKLRRVTGRANDARRDLEQLYKDHPDDLGARTALAELRYDQGNRVDAKTLFDETIHAFDCTQSGTCKPALDLDKGDQLYALAEAARYTSQHQLANDSYRAALKADPTLTGAGIAWADLFLDKYASELAEQTLEEVFKINPNEPEAHAAMAETIVETRYDLEAVRHHIDAALAVNPKNARALRVRASLQIDNDDWPAATKTLDGILAIDAEDVDALSMKATIAWLRDDTAGYDALRAKVFKINPGYAQLYRVVSRSAVREHRYAQAIELDKQAVALQPEFWEAMADAGLGYLRLGMEKEGIDWLEKSRRGDKFNVRAYNTLNLFDRIAKDYTFQATKNFKIRYFNNERQVLARYLEPTMEKAFADMVRRYGFTPKTPVTLELYADRTDYAIRTAGLPDIAALGVCFGQVITALSPATGDLNWGMVLWHELGHVFAIQLSNSRVPRWFTEGLSEYETLIARPEWRRENDADLYGAYANGTLPSIGHLNEEFMQPDQQGVIVAYFQSAVTIEYLAQTYGFPKIVEALKMYGAGKETPEVLHMITGKSIEQLDTDFRAYLDIRLAAYKGTFKLPSKGFDDVTKLEIAADAAPKDARAKANVALGYYYAGDADKAGQAAGLALQMDPKQPIARFITAEIAMHDKDVDTAKKLYAGLIADGHDSYDIRTRLAQIAGAAGDDAEVEKELCAAKKLDPERSYPYEELAGIYKKKGDLARSLKELEHYVMIEQMELAPLKELIGGYTQLANWAKVRTYGELAMYIQPGDLESLLALGRAYLELGAADKALFTYESALLVKPEPRRPALIHLGRAKAYLKMKKVAEARAAIAAAKQTEPENAEVLAVEASIH